MKSSFVLDLRYAVNGRETERERERETQRRISHRYGAVRREVVVAGAHAQRESGTNLSLGWRDEGNDKRCLNLSFVRIAKRICASRRTYSISATAITRDDSSRRQRRSRGVDLWGREGRKKGRKEKGGGEFRLFIVPLRTLLFNRVFPPYSSSFPFVHSLARE